MVRVARVIPKEAHMARRARTRTPFGPAYYRRVCLLTPDRTDPRDYDLTTYFGPGARGMPVPPKTDHTAEVGPVGDQGQTGSCVAWATAHGLRRWMTGLGSAAPALSVRFLWMGTKEVDTWELNVINDLAGTAIRSAFKVLNRTGVPLERFYRFRQLLVSYSPSEWNEMLADAANYRIGRYFSLGSNEAKEIQLAHCGPFVCGVPVYANFSRFEGRAVIPEPQGELCGGHAILVVAYDRKAQEFKFMNSWGKGWGDRGFGYLTYGWMKKHSFSAWAAAKG
jgi:hypothetical protein